MHFLYNQAQKYKYQIWFEIDKKKKKKKLIYTIKSVHQHRYNIHNPLMIKPLHNPIAISITNENENYSQQCTFLKSPNQTQFVNLEPICRLTLLD